MQINSRSRLLNRNTIGILFGFLDEFRLENSNGVGIVSSRILMLPVNSDRKSLNKNSVFIFIFYFRILLGEQMAAEFFKNYSRNSAHKRIRLRINTAYFCKVDSCHSSFQKDYARIHNK